jgi:hypothetical protein
MESLSHVGLGVGSTRDASLIIRPATPADRTHLRQAIVEPQDYERMRQATRLPGQQIADAYLNWMLR